MKHLRKFENFENSEENWEKSIKSGICPICGESLEEIDRGEEDELRFQFVHNLYYVK